MLMLLMLGQAHAASFIEKQIPNAQMVATARLTVFLFDIYDASFYTVNGKPEVSLPYALKLSYLRDFKGEKIADRSAEEMRLQQRADEVTLADWHAQMRNIFPDVKKGDNITGVYKDKTQCEFYKNSTFIGQVKDGQFCDMFFDIWFGEKTTAPELRNKLISQQKTNSASIQPLGNQ
jgi:glycosylphosphatidylinositol transamidase (GPIT) subunit GPI8